MPMQGFTTGDWRGLNQDPNPLSLEPGELRDCENVVRYGEMLGTRPGTERPGSGEDYENAITGTNPIRGAVEYRKNFDEGRALITVSDHATSQLWYEDGSMLPAGPTLNADQDYIYSFTIHNNVLWGTGGPPGTSSAVTEPTFTWDGDTGNAPATVTLTDKLSGNTLYPKHIASYGGYVLINGLQQAAGNESLTNNPMVSRYANFAEDPTDNTQWEDSNTIGFNPSRPAADAYGGNFTTGFSSYRDNRGRFLLVLSNAQIYAYRLAIGSDFEETDVIENGCVHERAYVSLGLDSGEGIFVSGGRAPAIHSLRQSQEHGSIASRFLSHKIREFMKTLNIGRIHHTCGVYDQKNGYVIFALTTGSDLTHGTLAVLDVGRDEVLSSDTSSWYLWKLSATASAINHLLYARDENDAFYVYGFTQAGDVIRFTTDLYSEYNDTAYGVKIRTRDDTYGSLHVSKTLGDVQVPVQSLGKVNASIRAVFDMGSRVGKARTLAFKSLGSTTWGSGVWGTSTWGSTSLTHTDKVWGAGSGQTVGFEVSHSGKNEPIRIGPIQHEVLVGGETGDEAAA